jgi:anti-sigma B factor antagonist
VRLSSRLKGDVAILSLSGKFVAGTDGLVLRQRVKELIDSGTRKLLFNFAEVPYIDSTGLGFLAGSRELAAEAGAIIVLTGMNSHVRRILDGVKLSQFFNLAEDEDAGLARIEQLGSIKPGVVPAEPAGSRQATKTPASNSQSLNTEAADTAQGRTHAAKE